MSDIIKIRTVQRSSGDIMSSQPVKKSRSERRDAVETKENEVLQIV